MDFKLAAQVVQRPLIVSLFGLTLVTGVIDAVSFLGLGHVFTANMTGNVVFVGFALSGAPDVSVVRSLVALFAFAGGGIGGGKVVNTRDRSPSAHLMTAMSLEVVLLFAAALATLASSTAASPISNYPVIVFTAVAMGLRNAVVRKLAVPDLTTTVLTLTVTGLAADSRLAGGTAPRQGRRLLSIMVMCAGALLGAALLRILGMLAALVGAAVLVAGLALYLYTNVVDERGTASSTEAEA